MSQEKEWFADFPRLTLLPWLLWAAIAFALVGCLYAGKVLAEPIAQASVNGGQVIITVYSEDCNLKDTVSNLPKRATCKEGGKVFEGCAGVQTDAGVAMLYFKEDKSVAIVPLQLFQRVTGA